MIVIGDAISHLVTSVNNHSSVTGGRTVMAFPDKYISSPLTETMFSLGIKKVNVGPRLTVENSNGTLTETRNRKVEITYSLTVYAPHSRGGDACMKGFDKWIDCLVRVIGMNIDSAGCDAIEYMQSIGTNVLKGYFVLSRTYAETAVPT